MAYIKSHSNYVLKKKHKNLDDGVIFERDYTTIGGVDNFTSKQTPIYRSSNFLITINNEEVQTKQHSSDIWEENENGELWSYANVSNASSKTEYDDSQIVIKNDYYKLSDFAYYGSCSELVRGSVNGILSDFPGELYITNTTLSGFGYSNNTTSENGLDNYYLVDNPFEIDIYTTYLSEDDDKKAIRYLSANDHWNNFVVIDNDGNIYSSITVNVTKHDDGLCEEYIKKLAVAKEMHLPEPTPSYYEGSVIYTVDIIDKDSDSNLLTIYCVYFIDGIFYFVSDSSLCGYHIRPKEDFLTKFYKSLDSFQSIILNPHSEPKYSVDFEIWKETEYGYETSIETFTFPIGRGGYNIGATRGALTLYFSKILTATEFYDTIFCDNLYRMMTHESIKNFDWTYKIDDPIKEEWKESGDKIEKLIRLFGREFDEIKFYIDGITHYNNITYNDTNNLPDYFLSDVLESDGWDIKNIYPLKMSEYLVECTESGDCKVYRNLYGNCFLDSFTGKIKGNEINIDGVTVDEAINVASADTNVYVLNRLFSQDVSTKITPYKDRLDYPNGYFNICNCDDDSGDHWDNCSGEYKKISSSGNSIYLDSGCTVEPILRKRIKKFSSDKEYAYKDINTIFLKRLKLNSRDILRHKGTIQGIEMMFGLFGLTSKRFLDDYVSTDTYSAITSGWDYDIHEYVSFTNPLLDPYWCCKDMTRLDWYNSTKTIPYNTTDFKNGIYINYQGLPISFRDVYYGIENNDGQYVVTEPLDNVVDDVIKYNDSTYDLIYMSNGTSASTKAYKYRQLYPYFDSDAILDGDPYYQMNGGWIKNEPYMYDKNNLIMSGTTQGNVNALWTETIDTLKVVENMRKLTEIPTYELTNGAIYKVNDLSGEFLLVDGYLYEVFKDYRNNRYINVKKANDAIKIGTTSFDTQIYVSNVYGDCNPANTDTYSTSGVSGVTFYDLSSIKNGDSIRIYLVWDNGFKGIIAQDAYETSSSTVSAIYDNLKYINDGNFSDGEDNVKLLTNCFKIIDNGYKLTINGLGWNQLLKTDIEYIKINGMTNYYKGNNPHTGKMNYDGGYKYMENFVYLFNYSIDNELFDSRKYNGDIFDHLDYIGNAGFSLLTNDSCSKDYPLYEDEKIHFFGNWFNIGDDSEKTKSNEHNDWEANLIDGIFSGGTTIEMGDNFADADNVHSDNPKRTTENKFDIRDYNSWYDYSAYSGMIESVSGNVSACTIFDTNVTPNELVCSGMTPDGSTMQIVNTKVVEITINLCGKRCSGEDIVNPTMDDMLEKDVMEEIKYFQSVVMPYVTQMIPSSTILKVNYKLRGLDYPQYVKTRLYCE